MLADEVTHVKMGSDWLRRITATDPERQKQALDFQKAVDKLFSFGGFRGEQEENPVHLARNFRRLAGFTDDEITDLVDIAAEAYAEAQSRQARPPRPPATDQLPPLFHVVSTSTAHGRGSSSSATDWPAWALGAHWWAPLRSRAPVVVHRFTELSIFVQAGSVSASSRQDIEAPQFHMFYGFVAIIVVGSCTRIATTRLRALYLLYGGAACSSWASPSERCSAGCRHATARPPCLRPSPVPCGSASRASTGGLRYPQPSAHTKSTATQARP